MVYAYFDEGLQAMLPVYFNAYFGELDPLERREALESFTAVIKSDRVAEAREERRELYLEEMRTPPSVH